VVFKVPNNEYIYFTHLMPPFHKGENRTCDKGKYSLHHSREPLKNHWDIWYYKCLGLVVLGRKRWKKNNFL